MIIRMWAEFNNSEHEVITGIFGSPQPVEGVPFMDEMFADDPRYKVWWDNLMPGTLTNNLSPPLQDESE